MTFQWGEQWATLLGAFVALIAAMIAAYFINKQISLTIQLSRDDLRQRLQASKAVMPLTLTKIIEYLEELSDRLQNFRNAIVIGDPRHILINIDKIPENIITDLKEVVQLEIEESRRLLVVELIGELQIMLSRARGLRTISTPTRSHPEPRDVESVLADLVYCHALTGMLFDYARGSQDFSFDKASAVWNSAASLWFTMKPELGDVRRILTAKFGKRADREFEDGFVEDSVVEEVRRT